jgi:hypothetical protein
MMVDLTKLYIMIEISFKTFKQQPKKIICFNGYTKDVISQVVKPKPMMMRLTTISKIHHLWVSPTTRNAQPSSPPCVNLLETYVNSTLSTHHQKQTLKLFFTDKKRHVYLQSILNIQQMPMYHAINNKQV